MALASITIACFLFYLPSKYFPVTWKILDEVKSKKIPVMILASAFAFFALVIWSNSFGFATGLMIWVTALMTILCAMVLSLAINKKLVSLWIVVLILSLIINPL